MEQINFGSTSGSRPYCTLTVTAADPNVELNQTTVSFSLVLHRPSSISSTATKSWSVTIDGKTHSGSGTIGGSGDKTLLTGSQTITHNPDGAKSIAFSGSAKLDITWSGTPLGTISGNSSMNLATIPRTSSFGSISGNTIGSGITVNINRNSSSFTHYLYYYIGSMGWQLIGTGIGTSITFTPAISTCAPYMNASATMYFLLRTYNGSTQIGGDVTTGISVYLNSKSTCSYSNSQIGSGGTITVNRLASSYTHDLWYSFGGISWKYIGSASTSSSFSLDMSTFASQIPNATSGTLYIHCRSYNNGTTIGDYTYSQTVYLPDNIRPTLGSFTMSGVNLFKNKYVQYLSQVSWSMTGCVGIYGSTISKYAITGTQISASTSTGTSSVLTNTGTLTYTASITDSRGRTDAKTYSIIVLSYTKPSCSITVERGIYSLVNNVFTLDESNGTTLRLKPQYSYHNVENLNSISSKVVTSNSLTVNALGSGEYVYLGKPDKENEDGKFSTDNSYSVDFTVIDEVGNSASVQVSVPTGKTIMDILADGSGVAFGKVAQLPNTLDIDMILKARKGIQGQGNTFIDLDNILVFVEEG